LRTYTVPNSDASETHDVLVVIPAASYWQKFLDKFVVQIPEVACVHKPPQCLVWCSRCKSFAACNQCHDKHRTDHQIKPELITHAKCRSCFTEIAKCAWARHEFRCPNCCKPLAKFCCETCCIFNSEPMFHCEGCGFCRQGVESAFEHCKLCKQCVAKSKPHRCYNQECSICLEGLSLKSVVVTLPCFHRLHQDCWESSREYLTSCPVCRFDLTVRTLDDKKRQDIIKAGLASVGGRSLPTSSSLSPSSPSLTVANPVGGHRSLPTSSSPSSPSLTVANPVQQ